MYEVMSVETTDGWLFVFEARLLGASEFNERGRDT